MATLAAVTHVGSVFQSTPLDSPKAVLSPARPKTTSPIGAHLLSWISELSRSEETFNPEELIEKTAVLAQLRVHVEELEADAWKTFCENPVSLEDNFHETHYFIPKSIYAELEREYLGQQTPGLTPVSVSAIETATVDIDELHRLELSLGSIGHTFEEETLRQNEELYASGIVSEQTFVDLFKRNAAKRATYVQVALLRSEMLYQQIYEDYSRKRHVNASLIPTAREGLLTLYQCEHPTIKSHVLDRLIDLLHADPLAPESYYNLPADIQLLMTYVELKSCQNLDEGTLSKLIEVFALSINNMWLYSNSENTKTAAVIEDPLRHRIWEAADSLKELNKTNPSLNFWIDFAIQAAQGIKTNVTPRQETLERLKHLSLAIVSIATIIGRSTAKKELDVSKDEIENIITHLAKVFYHLRSKEEWFESLLAFKYLCHLTRYCPAAISHLVEMALHYKCEETDPNLFLGMVCHLESLILHSTHTEITESSLKILMTLIFFDNELIQKRIIQALYRMKNIGRSTLSIAAECLLHLIYQSNNRLRDSFPSLVESKPLPERFKTLSSLGQTLCTHVMALFIRFTVNIQTESGLSAESLLCQLSRSTTGDLDGDGTARVEDMMQALKAILPNPLTPDADGDGILHQCVRRGNASLITTVMKVFAGQIDTNATNYEGRTPLMLCLEPKSPPFLEGIEVLAKIKGTNPNARDRYGKTLFHYLVDAVTAETVAPAEVERIFRNVRFTTRVEIDGRDASGYTPLMRSLRNNTPKSLEVAKILIKNGAGIHVPDPSSITPLEMIIQLGDPALVKCIPTTHLIGPDKEYTCFMMAAQYGCGEILDYLFNVLPEHDFSRVEAIAVMKSAFSSLMKLKSADKVLSVIQKHSLGAVATSSTKEVPIHRKFLTACEEALPGFDWRLDDDHFIKFTFMSEEIPPREIQAAIDGLKCSEQAAKVFGVCPAMRMCFRASNAQAHHIVDELRRDPSQLRLNNVLGRNMMQVALLESSQELKRLVLCYERQHFDNPDHRGNQPLHYACAILDAESYRTILSKVGHVNAMPLNNLGLPPIVMALQIPQRMLPEATSKDYNPYPSEYTASMHANFCRILDDTLRWHQEKGSLNPDKSAPQNPLNYRNKDFGWNTLHYAAVYGHPQQAYEMSKRMPSLFFEVQKTAGRIPVEQALFRNRIKTAEAMIRGWIDQQKETSDPKPLSTLYDHLAHHGLSLWSILAEIRAVDLIQELEQEGISLINFEETDASSRFRFSIGTDIQQYHMDYNPFAVCVQTAIRTHNTSLLSYLAESFPEKLLSLRDEAHNTPLMLATRMRRSACMSILIDLASSFGLKNSYIRTCNISGQYVIHILSCTPRTSALEQIIGVNPDITLHEANALLDAELDECLEILLDAGASLSQRDDAGNTALHLICGHNHGELIAHIYRRFESLSAKELGQLFNAMNDDKRSPIFAAVANASMEAFSYLISLKELRFVVDLRLDIRDINGMTLLHIAAQEGQATQLEICKTLIKHGVALEAIDEKGETALHKAAFNRRLEILNYLLALTASSPGSVKDQLMSGDFSLMTALHKAILLPPELYRRSLRRHCEKRLITASGLSSPIKRSKLVIVPAGAATLPSRDIRPLSSLGHVRGSFIYAQESSGFEELTSQALSLYGSILTSSSSSTLEQPNHFDPAQIKLINNVIVSLLDFGFSMEAADQQGFTPWHYLMRGPYSPVLNHILEYYALRKRPVPFTTLRTHNLETVAHLAAKFGQSEQLQTVSLRMKAAYSDSLNLKTKEGFTAIALALLADHLDCVDVLMAMGCRLDRSSRLQEHSARAPKGRNLLHLIAQKREVDERLSALFDTISVRHPYLLETADSTGKTVFEEVADNGHTSLLPLTLIRMPKKDISRQAISRALGLVKAKISSLKPIGELSDLEVSKALEVERSLSQLRLILSFGKLQEELGKALTGFRGAVNPKVVAPSLETLIARAEAVQEGLPATGASLSSLKTA